MKIQYQPEQLGRLGGKQIRQTSNFATIFLKKKISTIIEALSKHCEFLQVSLRRVSRFEREFFPRFFRTAVSAISGNAKEGHSLNYLEIVIEFK